MVEDPTGSGSLSHRDALRDGRRRQPGLFCINAKEFFVSLQDVDCCPVVGHEFLNLSAEGLADLFEVHRFITEASSPQPVAGIGIGESGYPSSGKSIAGAETVSAGSMAA